MPPKDETQTGSVYEYRDQLVNSLSEKLGLSDSLSPEQKMAKLMGLGAKTAFKNYVAEELTELNTPSLSPSKEGQTVNIEFFSW